ncbi:MAG: hypothetical protein Q8P05_02430 [Candidatus Diapherotrites archaeon]|nr:hypothetical protein [Candidatus Diapherotrites archaeon]
MYPEILIKNSRIYSQKILGMMNDIPIAELSDDDFKLSISELKTRIPELENNLKMISDFIKVIWRRKEIRIYVLPFRAHNTTFSDPLTISLCTSNGKRMDNENLIYLITHELIHNALEEIKVRKGITELKKDFPTLENDSYSHILVYAIQNKLFRKINKEYLCENEIEKRKNHKSTQEAWKIVREKGFENIISNYILEM